MTSFLCVTTNDDGMYCFDRNHQLSTTFCTALWDTLRALYRVHQSSTGKYNTVKRRALIMHNLESHFFSN